LPALYQDDDDGNDLSDLGITTGKKNSVDGDEDEQQKCGNTTAEECVAGGEEEDVFRAAEEPVADVKVATVTESVAENGFDRAIKDYVDFAESKRSSVAKCDEQQQQNQQQQQPMPRRKPLVEAKRRMSAPKIEEKVMLLKTRSQSTKDLNAASELPKVDIGKRREIFEKICSETKAAAEAQIVVVPKQPVPAKKKSLEVPLQVAIARSTTTVIRPQVIEEMSPPDSPPPSSGKTRRFNCS